jgi:hypothetical protein
MTIEEKFKLYVENNDIQNILKILKNKNLNINIYSHWAILHTIRKTFMKFLHY